MVAKRRGAREDGWAQLGQRGYLALLGVDVVGFVVGDDFERRLDQFAGTVVTDVEDEIRP